MPYNFTTPTTIIWHVFCFPLCTSASENLEGGIVASIRTTFPGSLFALLACFIAVTVLGSCELITSAFGVKKTSEVEVGVGAPIVLDKASALDAAERASMETSLRSLTPPATLSAGAALPMTDTEQGTPATETLQSTDNTGAPVTYITTTKKYKASAAFDTQVLLNPSTDVVYPGSVLMGESIDDGSYKEVTTGSKRAVSVSFDLSGVKDSEGKAGSVSGSIIPSLSRYRELRNRILAQQVPKQSTIYTMAKEEILSEEEFNLKINAGAAYKSPPFEVSVKAGFHFQDSTVKSRMMIKFMQTFYTVDIDQGSGTFLYDDFNSSIFGGFRPVYVSSIAYGRLAYITVESSQDTTTIEGYLNAAFQYGPGAGSLDVEAAKSWLNANTTTNITVIGGSVIATTLDSFMTMLADDTFSEENSGKIISYKLRFVDDNTIANTIFNGEYTVRSTTPQVGGGIDVELGISAFTSQCGDGDDNKATYYGSITCKKEEESTALDLWAYAKGNYYTVNDFGTTPYTGALQKLHFENGSKKININMDVKEYDEDNADEVFVNPSYSVTIADLKNLEPPLLLKAPLDKDNSQYVLVTIWYAITYLY
jgi:thiol-activated cytolysin